MKNKPKSHIQKHQLDIILAQIRSRNLGETSHLIDRIITQLRDYYKTIPSEIIDGKLRTPTFIIGISGGIDSAVVATLAVLAIGKENVIGITLPSGNEDGHGILRAQNLCSILNLKTIEESSTISIAPMLDAYWKQNPKTPTKTLRFGNFASRLRVAVLYDIQKRYNGRVLGTANFTEIMQGYSTKYGTPMSYDFGVLDELFKQDIVDIAKYLNIPQDILDATPSTGFSPKQTHESELGATLNEQDAGVFLLFNQKQTADNASATYDFSKFYLESLMKRFTQSAHKRMLEQPHICFHPNAIHTYVQEEIS